MVLSLLRPATPTAATSHTQGAVRIVITPELDTADLRNKENAVLYATVLGWSGETLRIRALNEHRFDASSLESITLLGIDGELGWVQDAEGFDSGSPGRSLRWIPQVIEALFDRRGVG